MKKLIFVLAFLLAYTVTNAQTVTLYGKPAQQSFTYTTDVTITDATPIWYLIKTDTDWPTTQHALIDIDSVSGNHTAVALLLYGRNFDDAAWTAISSTIVDLGVNSNLDITLTNTTETRWRQFKLLLTGTGTGVSKVDKLDFLILNPD